LTGPAEFQNIFNVNVNGPFYLARALVRSWLSVPVPVDPSTPSTLDITSLKGANLGKQILFVSSISALVAMTPQRQAAYNASKGAVTMLSKVGWASRCIRTSR
jgi:NAD(P)-dependent dehydrogenase (short-subunit alcohol dehydrogenase family)